MLLRGVIVCCFVLWATPVFADFKSKPIEPEVQKVGKINFIVDPRQEALSIVQYLGDYFLSTRYEHDYRDRVSNYFRRYARHEAVRLFGRLSEKGFKFSVPPEAVLYLDYDFSTSSTPPGTLLPDGVSQKDLVSFYTALSDFVDDSNFHGFFEANRPFYQQIIQQGVALVDGKTDIGELEGFYGKSSATYNIVLVPLFHHGGFGPEKEDAQGRHLYSIIGPAGAENGVPSFGARDELLHLINHEFSHSFIKHPFDAFSAEIAKSDSLWLPIKEAMRKQGYYEWQVVLNEHVVRSVTSLVAMEKNEQLGKQFLQQDKDKGFAYLDFVVDQMRIYQAQRERYSSFDDFFPTFVDAITEFSSRQ